MIALSTPCVTTSRSCVAAPQLSQRKPTGQLSVLRASSVMALLTVCDGIAREGTRERNNRDIVLGMPVVRIMLVAV